MNKMIEKFVQMLSPGKGTITSPEVVLKLEVSDGSQKILKNFSKNLSRHTGVDSICLDMKDKKLTVFGDVDPITVVSKLKKICQTEILSVGPAKGYYSFKDMLHATNNFSHQNLIMEGALGKVYKGQLDLMNLVIQRLNLKVYKGHELQTEISKLRSLEHKNIANVWGLCDENNEKIIVYKAFGGTLNQHISDPTLTWTQRLHICLGVARALNHIHYDVIHCDINSSKVILDQDWEPKIYGFELSAEYPQSWMHRVRFSRYLDTNNLTPKYDVYCFGVLMLEVLCGRKPMITDDGVQEDPDKIIDPILKKQMDTESMTTFTNIAYKCLKQELVERPTMDQIVKELEEVLELQWKHADLFVLKEHSIAADEGASSNNLKGETIVFLRYRLSDILVATENFAETCRIGLDANGTVYKAELDQFSNTSLLATEGMSNVEPSKITVAIKHIANRKGGQGKQGLFAELEMRAYKHPNIVSLLGFCDEGDEMILVYKYASNRSLDDYLKSVDNMDSFTWIHRLHMCLEIARGLNHLHTMVNQSIIHSDIRSANILLDEKPEAKIGYFVISDLHPKNQEICMKVYNDPEKETQEKLNIYSFGVVLFEMFSGRVAYDPVFIKENEKGLAAIACQCFNDGTIERIMDPKLKKETDEDISTSNTRPNQDSMDAFVKVAYQCLGIAAKRLTIDMEEVIKELEKALKLQESQCFPDISTSKKESFDT